MILGYNYRMTEVTAAIGIEQLKKLDKDLRIRRELAETLTSELACVEGISPPYVHPDASHAYYTYPVVVRRRDEFQEKILKRGVYFGQGGYKPLHLFSYYGGMLGQLPVAEWAEKNIAFTDIIKQPLTSKDIKYIIECIKQSVV